MCSYLLGNHLFTKDGDEQLNSLKSQTDFQMFYVALEAPMTFRSLIVFFDKHLWIGKYL